ncbi:MAG: peptidase M64 [Acidobacteria bacterium]|nr:MAG: peptidase M64 [Acidobacteriota bacterium]
MVPSLLLAAGLASAAPGGGAPFAADFTGATLRVDLYHSGTSSEEHFAIRRLRVEGPWPGSRTRLIDTSNLGKYMVEVADLATNRVLYSRGFASIYGEWETTAEADREWGTFEEAVRVPEPRRPFQLRLRKRGPDGTFREIWRTSVDPRSRFVDRPAIQEADVTELMIGGDPARKVDLLVLGDGYTAAQRPKFLADARRALAALFAVEPFRSRKEDFNVRALFTPSPQPGITRPRAGIFRDTPLGTRYNAFDSERYVLTFDDHRWRDIAASAPYDVVAIMVNERKYGGGGIFNLYCTFAADSAFADYLFVHEFGHHIAGLADEYYTSDVAYEELPPIEVEPWEPNISALLPDGMPKWRALLSEGVPVPTPWDKETFEKESRARQERRRRLRAEGAPEEELERLFAEERSLFTAMLASERYAGKVGAFEGAGYRARGLYRPSTDCIMFTRDEVGFCPVCAAAIDRVIDGYTE